ncbi:MAG TPA: amino acid permease [Candidatus Acidoferrales bacterium]|nr:amino acid permease [Candidatus Acidoferrales bacterium]
MRSGKQPPDVASSQQAKSTSTSPHNLRKELNLFDAVAIVVGTTIGSGIFLIPSSIASELNSLGIVLLVWIIGGVLTIFGALSLAELGSIYPGTGGLCTYLRQAYGPFVAFLYAWGLLFMIHSGSIAALAVGFSLYAGQIFPLTLIDEKLLSAALILIFTFISCLGIRGGKLTQNLIATAKITGLAGIILLLCFKGTRPIHLFNALADPGAPAFSFAEFGIALVAVLFAYEGWHVISFVAGEMKRPQIDLPRALFYGTAIIMLIYLTANIGYYHLLSPAEIRGSAAVAAYSVGKILGPIGRNGISVLILVSILGSINGMVLTGPRVYYAMAHDSAFPRIFGQINDRYRTPMLALIVQGIWSAVLALSGTYQQLFTDVIFAAWIFYGLAVAGVLVLRRNRPQLERPFHVPGYPWIPLLFSMAAIGVVLSTIIERPIGALVGTALVASGVPVYFFVVKRAALKTQQIDRAET